jgi:hypothetical protein
MPKSVQEYRKCGFGHSRKRDVLTGIITSLLAQSYEPITAAVLGAYLHGLAADIALPETGYQSFIASDIKYLGKHFEYYKIKALKRAKKVYIFNSLNKSISSVSDGLGALNLQCCHLGRLE